MPPTCSLVLNVMADASSVAQLREELAFHGLGGDSFPADDLLQVMLDVEGGDVRAAARSILDAQAAERRVERANPTLSLIHISEPTRPVCSSRMPSSA